MVRSGRILRGLTVHTAFSNEGFGLSCFGVFWEEEIEVVGQSPWHRRERESVKMRMVGLGI